MNREQRIWEAVWAAAYVAFSSTGPVDAISAARVADAAADEALAAYRARHPKKAKAGRSKP